MGYTAIIDYGVGNLKSVSNALAYLGVDSEITGDPCRLELADAIILPGVGAFPDAADKLRETARLRLEHPEDTLAELAALCDPPATKSALNHRLRKLVELGQARGEGAGHT